MLRKTLCVIYFLLVASNITACGMPAPPYFACPSPQVGLPGGDVASDMFTASEPDAPRIAAFSHEAYPDETVFLTGTGLEGAEFQVGFMASGGQLVTRHASVQIATDSYALVTLPDRIPRTFYFLWAGKEGKWSDAARINLPEPWWAYPNDPRPGEQVRVFGRELAVLPTLSNAYIYLERNDKTGQYVAPDFCDR